MRNSGRSLLDSLLHLVMRIVLFMTDGLAPVATIMLAATGALAEFSNTEQAAAPAAASPATVMREKTPVVGECRTELVGVARQGASLVRLERPDYV